MKMTDASHLNAACCPPLTRKTLWARIACLWRTTVGQMG